MTETKTEMTPQQVLALPMQPNDCEAATIRDYLRGLLEVLWREEEGFNGKRPFGNSGWQHEVYRALAAGGAVETWLDKYKEPDYDREECDRVIQAAIAAM